MRNLFPALACTLALFGFVPLAYAGDDLVVDAVNSLLGLVFAIVLPIAAWLGHRAVTVIEDRTGIQLQQLHGPALDQAIALAVQYVQGVVTSAADAGTAVALRNQTVAQAANLIVAHGNAALATLGVTRDHVIDRINLALGAPPVLPLTQPAPVSADDLVARIKAALAGSAAAGAVANDVAAAAPALAATAGVAASAVAAIGLLFALQGCAAAGIAADVAAAQPIAADIACWSQSAANVTTDALTAAGDTAGAAKSAEVSAITGAACTAINLVQRAPVKPAATALAAK